MLARFAERASFDAIASKSGLSERRCAFTAMVAAMMGMVSLRRFESPAYAAAKTISLAAAAVSMLALTNTLLTTFGQGGEAFHRIMLAATGTVVILLVQGIALYMIIHGNRMLAGLPTREKKEA